MTTPMTLSQLAPLSTRSGWSWGEIGRAWRALRRAAPRSRWSVRALPLLMLLALVPPALAVQPLDPGPGPGSWGPASSQGEGQQLAPLAPYASDARAVGLELPPGLPAGRREVRESEREAALVRLRSWWPQIQPAERAALEDLLNDVDAASEEFEAWAGALAALGAQGFAGNLAGSLEAGTPPRRRAAARRALHDLLGPWFDASKEVEPFAELSAGAVAAYGPRLHAQQSQRRASIAGVWTIDPASAVVSLGDSDPDLVAAAAESLAQAVGHGELNAFTVAEALWSALLVEHDLQAACELVDALTLCLRGTTPPPEWIETLRGELQGRLALAPSRSALCWASLLTALPGVENATDDVDRSHYAVGGLLVLLERSASGTVDSDVEVGLLQALRSAASGMEPEARAGLDLFAPTRERLARPEIPVSVRAAAAAAWGDVAETKHLPTLWELLVRDLPEAEVLFPLLGGLSRLASDGGWSPENLSKLSELCGVLLESGDVDLIRRALDLLEAPDLDVAGNVNLQSALATVFEGTSPAELRLEAMTWIGRAGSIDDLRALFASSSFADLLADESVLGRDVDAALTPLFARWGAAADSLRIGGGALLVEAGRASGQELSPLALEWTSDLHMARVRSGEDASRELLRIEWAGPALDVWQSSGRLDETLRTQLLEVLERDLPHVLAVSSSSTADEAFRRAVVRIRLQAELLVSLDSWRMGVDAARARALSATQVKELDWLRIAHLRMLDQEAEALLGLRDRVAWNAWRELRFRSPCDSDEWLRVAREATAFDTADNGEAANTGLAALLHLDRRAPTALEDALLLELASDLGPRSTDGQALSAASRMLRRRAAALPVSEGQAFGELAQELEERAESLTPEEEPSTQAEDQGSEVDSENP